jgi:archaellum component FlaD/FlaE
MEERMGDSTNNVSNDYDLGNELSNLVNQKVIPQRIAEKLEKKLKEKKIKISKQQLYTLVYKLRDIINDYKKSDHIKNKTESPVWEKQDTDMQNLIQTVENLEERISHIESGAPSDLKVVTTDDIKVNQEEWELTPLKDIPNDPERIIVIMKWLQFLIDKCGRDNLTNILDYYVDIGWISEDAKIRLVDFSHGITEDNMEGENVSNKDITNLPSKDHIQSLIFIQKLKGKELDKHFLDKIDGELNRISKKLNNYQFK